MKTLLNIIVLIAVISSSSNQLMAQWVQTGGPEGGEEVLEIVGLFVGHRSRSEWRGSRWATRSACGSDPRNLDNPDNQ